MDGMDGMDGPAMWWGGSGVCCAQRMPADDGGGEVFGAAEVVGVVHGTLPDEGIGACCGDREFEGGPRPSPLDCRR